MGAKAATPSILRTLLICSDPQIRSGLEQVDGSGIFQILGDWVDYPSRNALSAHLGRLTPHVVLLDFATDPERAISLLREISSLWPLIRVIALHRRKDADCIVDCVRAGASEFLTLPIDRIALEEAAARVRVRLEPEDTGSNCETGTVLAFTSAKPGSGASSLASQTAFSLRAATQGSVLLIDLDLMGGTLADVLKSSGEHSVLYLLRRPATMKKLSAWKTAVSQVNGVDVLAAPDSPVLDVISPGMLQELIFYARSFYDYVILDLPCFVSPMVRLALREVDTLYVVTAPELPSLHLARRSIASLDRTSELGDRVRVVLNRSSIQDPLRGRDVSKLFNRAIDVIVPNDYLTLQAAMKLAEPVNPKTKLGQAIRSLWRQASPKQSLTRRFLSALRLGSGNHAAARTPNPSICQASEVAIETSI